MKIGVAILASAVAATAGPQLLSQSNLPLARSLLPGPAIQDTLAGAERAVFSIDVPANTAAHVVISQESVDVKLILRPARAAAPAYWLDFVGGPDGDEELFPPIADVPATWNVIVAPAIPSAERGSYTIRVETTPADAHARAIAAARAAHYRALDPTPVIDNASTSNAQAGYLAAAAAAQDAGDLVQAAESTYQAARTFDVLGDQPSAIAGQQRALAMFRQLGRQDREARVLNRLGDLSRKIGDVSAAEQYFQEALPIARARRDAAAVVDILNNSGLLLLSIGRYEDAIAQLQGAIPMAQALESVDVETALSHNTGDAYKALGDYDHAIQFFERARELAERLAVPRRIARAQQGLAAAHFELGDRVNADRAIQSAMQLYETAGDRAGLAEATGYFALMQHASGDSDQAVRLFAQVQPTLHEIQNRLGEARVLTAWAEVDTERGDVAAALPKLDDALRLAREIASPATETQALYGRARALARADRIDDAVEAIARAIAGVEDTRGAIQRSDLRTSYLARVRSYYDLYVELLQRRGDPAAAFRMSERGRARTLLEGLAEGAARIKKGVDPALAAERRRLQAQLNAKVAYRAQQTLQRGDRSPAAVAAGREIDDLIQRLKDVEHVIRTTNPAYWALQQPEPVDVAQVQREVVDAGSALVEYHLGRDHSYAWVIDSASITAHELPTAAVIDDLARRYHTAVSRDPDALAAGAREKLARDVSALGRRLAAAVWTPIAPRVGGKRVLVVAEGALQYVPFSALPAESGRPLLAEHEIVYLPSASVLATLRRDHGPTRAGAVAVFADPVFSKSDPRVVRAAAAPAPVRSRADDGGLYGRLRFSRLEANAITAAAPGAFTALDFSASKASLLGRDLTKYRILHFATHGTLNADRPELSGLVLSLVDAQGAAVDGVLRLHEIYNLNLDADLVVLSACRTALGKDVHGEGLIGLTRGFMYAGAARVVSSIWNVDDRASARLMTLFYESMITRKLPPAAALRQAQRTLLADPRWANPHYWAAFGLYGEPR